MSVRFSLVDWSPLALPRCLNAMVTRRRSDRLSERMSEAMLLANGNAWQGRSKYRRRRARLRRRNQEVKLPRQLRLRHSTVLIYVEIVLLVRLCRYSETVVAVRDSELCRITDMMLNLMGTTQGVHTK